MKGGSGGAGGALVQVEPLAPRLLGESSAASTPGGAQQQKLHFNYQLHIVLLMADHLGGAACLFTTRKLRCNTSKANTDRFVHAWPVITQRN